jgi:hypothetical protein
VSEIDSNALFVRDGDRIGIITGMNLSKAVAATHADRGAGAVAGDFRRCRTVTGRFRLLGHDPDDQGRQAAGRGTRRHTLCRDLARATDAFPTPIGLLN